MGSARAEAHTTRSGKPKTISGKASVGWWTSTWRSSSTGLNRLMSTLAKRVQDKRLLKLIRSFLNSGVLEDGLVRPVTEGAPLGGPLSPLLSNIILDELDKELEKRGHRFVRYADDCNIYVKSRRAGERVMESVTKFIEGKLKLKVNRKKSAVVDPPWKRKFLGFSFTPNRNPKIRIANKSKARASGRLPPERCRIP